MTSSIDDKENKEKRMNFLSRLKYDKDGDIFHRTVANSLFNYKDKNAEKFFQKFTFRMLIGFLNEVSSVFQELCLEKMWQLAATDEEKNIAARSSTCSNKFREKTYDEIIRQFSKFEHECQAVFWKESHFDEKLLIRMRESATTFEQLKFLCDNVGHRRDLYLEKMYELAKNFEQFLSFLDTCIYYQVLNMGPNLAKTLELIERLKPMALKRLVELAYSFEDWTWILRLSPLDSPPEKLAVKKLKEMGIILPKD